VICLARGRPGKAGQRLPAMVLIAFQANNPPEQTVAVGLLPTPMFTASLPRRRTAMGEA